MEFRSFKVKTDTEISIVTLGSQSISINPDALFF